MECLAEAKRLLEAAGSEGDDRAPLTDAASRITAAEQSLERIAAMVGSQPAPVLRLGPTDRPRWLEIPLGVEVRRLAGAIGSRARTRDVDLSVRITPQAAALPTGRLSPLLHRGMDRAIERCPERCRLRRNDGGGSHVEVSLSVSASRDLIILISCTGAAHLDGAVAADTDPEPVPADDAIAVCRTVVECVGGTLSVRGVPFGAGEVLRAAVPLNQHLAP